MTVASLIDQWFPAQAIGAESLRERGSAKAFPPVNFIHVWWARRPLSASRAAVLGSLLPAWPAIGTSSGDAQSLVVQETLGAHFADEEAYHAWFLEVIGIPRGKDPAALRQAITVANAEGQKLKGNGYGYDRAFTKNPTQEEIKLVRLLSRARSGSQKTPVILDLFAGGGSIPFEAMRLGFDTFANELNPVASAILQGTLGVIHDFGADLSLDIAHWGGRWAESVQHRLDPFFPQSLGARIAGYIWVFCVPCPTTGRATPLAPNLWLVRTPSGAGDAAVRLEVAGETVAPVVVEGSMAAHYGDRATYKGGVGTSIWDKNTTFDGKYIRREASEGRGSYLLLAVAVEEGKGRTFRAPREDELQALAAAGQELLRLRPAWEIDGLVPDESVQPGQKTGELIQMGITRWSDAFMPRQLLANMILLEELLTLQGEMLSALGEQRGKAVALHLAYALDRALDYNSRLCSWDASRNKIRNGFDRHDFAFSWTGAEFDAARALVPWLVDNAARNHHNLSALVHGRHASLQVPDALGRPVVLRGSATHLKLPDESVDAVVTDPPYYDNVMYAELSDFFYVWLKRSLRGVWPQFTDLSATDKQGEAVANPSLFIDVATHKGSGRRAPGAQTAAELADQHYERLLTDAFTEAHRVLRPGGVLNVMFTHKRVDAWDTLGAALLHSGFAVNSSWPIATESENSMHQAKKNSARSTILLNCHKRGDTSPAYWADIRSDVEQAAVKAVQRFSQHGLRGVDLTLATYGPVLAVLSRNWPVFTGELDEAGQPEILRPDVALDLARERVAALKKRGLLGGRDVEFDRVTDWWLLAWSDFQAAEFPSGEALKLSLATHLDLETLSKTHRLIKAAGGKVTLLTPAQRRTAKGFDVDAGSFPIMIDYLHALMLIYEEDGVRAAAAWLARHALADDARFGDLVCAAIYAVPRRKRKGGFVRPEARILDSLRTSFFGGVPLPPDPDTSAAEPNLALF